MRDLKGKVAVVTGGASGIGEALVHAFAEVGMHVVVADIEEQKAEAVAKRYSGPGVRCLGIRVDVTDPGSVRALADRCYAELGAVHVLCNNAGVLLMGPQSDMTIGVSVVLPSDIRSQIVASQRNRPSQTGREYRQSVDPEVAARHGIDPRDVGIRVREGIERGEFYVFSLPSRVAPAQRATIEDRARELLEALEAGQLPE